MHIALDFDGVIADIALRKQAVAQEVFGLTVPIEMLSSTLVRSKESVLTVAQYEAVQRVVYSDPQEVEKLTGVPDALETLRGWAHVHHLYIVTARSGIAFAHMNEWLQKHGLTVPTIGVGYGVSKRPYTAHDVFVDDDLTHVIESAARVSIHFSPHSVSPHYESVQTWRALRQRVLDIRSVVV